MCAGFKKDNLCPVQSTSFFLPVIIYEWLHGHDEGSAKPLLCRDSFRLQSRSHVTTVENHCDWIFKLTASTVWLSNSNVNPCHTKLEDGFGPVPVVDCLKTNNLSIISYTFLRFLTVHTKKQAFTVHPALCNFMYLANVLSTLKTIHLSMHLWINRQVHMRSKSSPITKCNAFESRVQKNLRKTLSVLVGNWRPYTVQANFTLVKDNDSRDPSAVEPSVMGYF